MPWSWPLPFALSGHTPGWRIDPGVGCHHPAGLYASSSSSSITTSSGKFYMSRALGKCWGFSKWIISMLSRSYTSLTESFSFKPYSNFSHLMAAPNNIKRSIMSQANTIFTRMFDSGCARLHQGWLLSWYPPHPLDAVTAKVVWSPYPHSVVLASGLMRSS